jgi:hypothetical protein
MAMRAREGHVLKNTLVLTGSGCSPPTTVALVEDSTHAVQGQLHSLE